MHVFVDAWRFIQSNPGLLLRQSGAQLLLSAAALGAAIVLSLPVGVITGHLHRWSFLAINGGNVARALPTLAIIAIGISLYGLGFVNILVALVVLAIPLVLTNAHVAVAGVDPSLVEAARGMGMRPWQILVRVELPSAVPLVLGGIRTASVYVIASAYLASFAGYGATLGAVITNQPGYGLGGVLGATAVVVVLAFAAEAALAALQAAVTPRGLKVRAGAAAL
ncbi:MAG: ABC transporter permease [Acidimicrobiales bacterium]